MQTTYSFSFPSFIRDEFDKKFTRLNKKLAKMKDGNEVEIVGETHEDRNILKPDVKDHIMKVAHQIKAGANISPYIPTPKDYLKVNFTNVEVSLPVQNKIQGYQLLGNINIEGDVKTIHSLDDNINLTEVDVKLCHHCNTKRQRKALTVFKELSTGDLKAVGSTCVHDYLGVDIFPILNTFFNFYKEEDLYGSNGMRKAWGYHIEELANASRVAYTQFQAYVKEGTTKARVDEVHRVMYNPSQYNMDEQKELLEVLKTAPKVGKLLLDTYKDMDATASNFNSNVVETLFYTHGDGTRTLRDFIVGKARGIFIWACFNALNKNAKPATPKAPTKPSNHIGKVGERIDFDGEVTFTKIVDGFNGESKMVKFQDKEGNLLVTFGTGDKLWDLKEGDEVSLRGTISKHDEFKGIKQTQLKRVG